MKAITKTKNRTKTKTTLVNGVLTAAQIEANAAKELALGADLELAADMLRDALASYDRFVGAIVLTQTEVERRDGKMPHTPDLMSGELRTCSAWRPGLATTLRRRLLQLELEIENQAVPS